MATALVVSFLLMTPAALAFPVLMVWAVLSVRRHDREYERICGENNRRLHEALYPNER